MKVIPSRVYDILINLLPMIILFCVVYGLIELIVFLMTKERVVVYKKLKNLLSIIYIFALFSLVMTTDFESYSNNFIPFKEMTRYSLKSALFYRNVFGNIALFIPFGFFITDMIKERTGKIRFFVTLFLTSVVSLIIEIIQMYIGRSFDIDDIILNIVGGLLGLLFYYIMVKIVDKLPKFINNNIVKALLLLIVFLAFFLGFFMLFEVRV